MADLSSLVDKVLQRTPGRTRADVLTALRDAAAEFCQRTHYWQEDVPGEIVVGGVSTYEPYSKDGQVIAVKSVRWNGLNVPAKDRAWLDREYPSWSQIEMNAPQYYTLDREGGFNVVLVPKMADDAAGELLVRVALMPKSGSNTIGDIVIDDYGYGIIGRAIVLLSMIPDESAKAIQSVAQFYDVQWEDALSRAKTAVLKGHTDAPLTMYGRTLA